MFFYFEIKKKLFLLRIDRNEGNTDSSGFSAICFGVPVRFSSFIVAGTRQTKKRYFVTDFNWMLISLSLCCLKRDKCYRPCYIVITQKVLTKQICFGFY